MYLRDYRRYIEKDNSLTIRTAPKTRHGISNVYNEKDVPFGLCRLSLASAAAIERDEIKSGTAAVEKDSKESDASEIEKGSE